MPTKPCPDCDRPGGSFLTSDGKCSTCHGSGKDKILLQALDYAMGGGGDCEVCGGTGECQTCEGTGEVEDDGPE